MAEHETKHHRDETDPSATQGSTGHSWLWWGVVVTIVLVLVVLVLAAAAPSLLSTGAGRRFVQGRVNAGIAGEVTIDDLSLSWFGQTHVGGVQVNDPNGKDVLSISSVRLQRGLWDLLWTGGKNLAVEVDDPHITLLLDESGKPTLASAFVAPGEVGAPQPPSEEPTDVPEAMNLNVRVRGGRVRVVKHTGQELVLRDIDVRTVLVGGDRLTLEAGAQVVDAGPVRITANIVGLQSLTGEGQLDLHGDARVHTQGRWSIQPLAEFARPGATLTGQVGLAMSVRADGSLIDISWQGEGVGVGPRASEAAPAPRRVEMTIAGRSNVSVQGPARGRSVVADGNATVSGIRTGGERVEDVKLRWQRVTYRSGSVSAVLAELDSAFARMAARDVSASWEREVVASGTITGSADIGDALAVLRPILGGSNWPDAEGRAKLDITATTEGNLVTLSGNGDVTNLFIRRGQTRFSHRRTEWDIDGRLDRGSHDLTLTRASVDAGDLFQMTLSGNVRGLQARRVLDLSGRYEGSWEDILALARSLSPGAAEGVTITGRTEGPISITGPLGDPQITPTIRGVDANTAVTWESIRLWDLDLGKASITPRLASGVIELGRETIPAGEGSVGVAGSIDLLGPDKRFRLTRKTAFFESVALTPELTRNVLGQMNPIFAKIADVSGVITLELHDANVPLGEKVRREGTLSGRVGLENMRARPQGFLADVLKLAGRTDNDWVPLKVSGLDFQLRDGWVSYRNLKITAGDVDLEFNGSVGLNDQLRLSLDLPVTPSLLRKFGVSGKNAVDYAEILSAARVSVPLRGTVDNPRLELVNVDISGMLREAGKKLVEKKAADLLGDLLGGDKDEDDERRDQLPDSRKSEDPNAVEGSADDGQPQGNGADEATQDNGGEKKEEPPRRLPRLPDDANSVVDDLLDAIFKRIEERD